jgi:Cdc6-like AAA superfamily ATPase
MPRAGRQREQLVEHFERLLATCKEAKVQSPGYLPDKVTGKQREFDVLIRVPPSLVIALEVRERRRKTDVTEIEGFAAKANDVDVSRKVFVSSSGFTPAARTKAAAYDIECRTVQEVKAIDWISKAFSGTVAVTHPKHVCYRLIPFDDLGAMAEAKILGLSQPTLQDVEVLNANNEVVAYDAIGAKAWSEAQKSIPLASNATGQITVVIDFAPCAPHFMRWKGSDPQFKLRSIEATIEYETTTKTLDHHLHQYRDESNGKVLAEAVESDPFPAFGKAASIMIAGKPGSGKTVTLVWRTHPK